MDRHEIQSLLPYVTESEIWLEVDDRFLYLVRPPYPRTPCRVIRKDLESGQETTILSCRCLGMARQELARRLQNKL